MQRATRAYMLHNPVEATELQWKKYAMNRTAADKMRIWDKKAAKRGYESPDSEDEFEYGEDESIYILRSIRRTLRGLEEEIGLPDMTLQKACKLLYFDGCFEEAYDVSNTFVYSLLPY